MCTLSKNQEALYVHRGNINKKKKYFSESFYIPDVSGSCQSSANTAANKKDVGVYFLCI